MNSRGTNPESPRSTRRALGAALVGAVLAGSGALLFAVFDLQSTKLALVVWETAPWAVFMIMPVGFTLILWLRDHVFPWTDGTVMVACQVLLVFLGNYFFYGRIDNDRLVPLEFMSPGPWIAVVLIGLAGGLLGGLFAKVLLVVVPHVSRLTRRHFAAFAVVIGLACAGLAWLSNGATLGTGYDQARALILQDSPRYVATLPPGEVARLEEVRENIGPWYALQRAAATMMVLLTGIPGGLFDPSFSIGAGLGHLTAPGLTVTGATVQGIILLWVAAYFSGVVQSPMTAFIILLEMTGAIGFTVPLGLASIVAYEASRRVCPVALYEALAENFLRAGEPVDVRATSRPAKGVTGPPAPR